MPTPNVSPEEREMLRQAREALDNGDLEAQANVRAFRNILLLTTLGLSVILALSPLLVALLDLNMVSLHKGTKLTTVKELLTVEMAGAFGGLVGAVGALRHIHGSRGPYGLPIAQLLLKLPAGALIALFALLIIQSGSIPFIMVLDDAKLVAYAAVFGFVQESVTRTIDRRANDLIGAARTQNDPQRPAASVSGGEPTS